MRLSDIVSHSGLAGFAEGGLILFLLAFLAIVVRLYWPSRRAEFEKDARIPLDDEPKSPPGEGASR